MPLPHASGPAPRFGRMSSGAPHSTSAQPSSAKKTARCSQLELHAGSSVLPAGQAASCSPSAVLTWHDVVPSGRSVCTPLSVDPSSCVTSYAVYVLPLSSVVLSPPT